jgi:hypothetical protein
VRVPRTIAGTTSLEVLHQPLDDKLVTISRHYVVQAGAGLADLRGFVPTDRNDESMPIGIHTIGHVSKRYKDLPQVAEANTPRRMDAPGECS